MILSVLNNSINNNIGPISEIENKIIFFFLLDNFLSEKYKIKGSAKAQIIVHI